VKNSNLNPAALLESLRALWPEIQAHGVKHLWVFGSSARGEDKADSDLDILVEFADRPDFDAFMGLKLFLEARMGKSVDLLSRSACQPRFFTAIQPDLLNVA
jgi:hypothetical protein